MKIILAKDKGFCRGVKRAYEMTIDALKGKESVFILGQLIHNSKAIEKLETMGVKSINNLSELSKYNSGNLIVSAHGVSPTIIDSIDKNRFKIIDTTCPWVRKTQKLAQELYFNGYHVIIIGDKNHAEVEGILGWTNYKAQVVENIEDLENVADNEKLGILVQTTQSLEKYELLKNALKSKSKELKAYNTICNATSKIKSAAIEILKDVDVMLVIGDFNSANTKRLSECCMSASIETYQIQEAKDIDKKWFFKNNRIGITAGASTPDWVIDEVIQELKYF